MASRSVGSNWLNINRSVSSHKILTAVQFGMRRRMKAMSGGADFPSHLDTQYRGNPPSDRAPAAGILHVASGQWLAVRGAEHGVPATGRLPGRVRRLPPFPPENSNWRSMGCGRITQLRRSLAGHRCRREAGKSLAGVRTPTSGAAKRFATGRVGATAVTLLPPGDTGR